MPLITTDELKLHLGLSGTGEDDYLAQLVAGVNSGIPKYLHRKLEAASGVIEYQSGNGRDRLYLKNRPVTAISGVWVDYKGYFGQAPGTPFDETTRLIPGVDYAVESLDADESNQSCLIKLSAAFEGGGSIIGGFSSTWSTGIGNIKVVYDCGYETIPDDVKTACLMIATAIRRTRKTGMTYSSESLGSYSYTLLSGHAHALGRNMDDVLSATGMLKPYREILI